MNPVVVWTFRGERQLHFLLSGLNSPQTQVAVQAELRSRLAMVFPTASAVIVLDMFFGFRQRPDEYTLLVDVRYPEERAGGTGVVKLADDHRLRVEHDAWLRTSERQFNGDGVLMRLTAAYHPQHRHQLVGLVYQDAATHIGMHRQVFLEDAFIGAVRHDSPTVESVLNCLESLFRTLGREFYAGRRQVRVPWTAALELNPDNAAGGRRSLNRPMRWADGPERSVLAEWGSPARQSFLRVVDENVLYDEKFVNPYAFFARFAARLTTNPADPKFAVPLTRGPSHGDLHGRNILVGLEDDRADRPAVYDYEHMSRDNLIHYDYAKLETELKVRAYPYILGLERRADEVPYTAAIRRIHAMEAQLAAGGEEYVRTTGDGEHLALAGRLFRLLAGLRRRAESTRPDREVTRRDWEREYLFVLAAYGMYTVRFAQPPLYQAVAVISAGVAAGVWSTPSEQTSTSTPGGAP